MKGRGVIGLGMCLGLVLALFGCGKDEGAGDRKTVTLAFVAGASTDFWTFARRGCEQADRELDDVSIDFRFTTDGTAVEQRRVLEDLQTRGIAGLAITPLDPANQGPLIDQLAGQIPVVITDSDIPASRRQCYVGTNNVDAGREAGRLLKELLPNGGKVMLFVGKTDAQNAKERIEGLTTEIQGTGIEVVDIRTDDIDRVRAKANVSDTLVKYPQVRCFVALWSYNGPAILSALKDAGKLGEVKVVAFDEEDDTLQGVKDGYIYATVVQQPFEFGYRSMHLLAEIIKGDTSSIPADRQIIIPTRIIKQDNAAQFMEKIQAMRRGELTQR
ncbi:MAG TPA: sugar-binding protein [Sedimentisphaerales bacterium]|nr:sugar-binding protein [Sedimentisphaerales bacterium]HRS12310.1 sugar-binding protein [Sedimentisphaerales bacterium]HRV48981.1 sugar-binding protein [Sedimentisphaerales bacterium]